MIAIPAATTALRASYGRALDDLAEDNVVSFEHAMRQDLHTLSTGSGTPARTKRKPKNRPAFAASQYAFIFRNRSGDNTLSVSFIFFVSVVKVYSASVFTGMTILDSDGFLYLW